MTTRAIDVLRQPLKKGPSERPDAKRSLNPWTLTDTYRTIDASLPPPSDLAEGFRHFGVIKVRNVLDQSEVTTFLDAARQISGLGDDDCPRVLEGASKSFASPGSVARNQDLWAISWQPRLLAVVRAILGPEARFFGRDSLGVHFSSVDFHKDTKISDQVLGTQGYPADFSTVRVIFYLNGPGRPATRFGFKPFSHRVPKWRPPSLARYGDDLDASPVWLDLDPTDCVLFDARMVHSGDSIDGPKYMIVLTYDRETPHALEVFHQTCRTRAGEGYGYADLSPEFLAALREQDLLISGLDDPERFADSMASQHVR